MCAYLTRRVFCTTLEFFVEGTAFGIPRFCFEVIIVVGNTSEYYPRAWFCEPQPSHVRKCKYRLGRNCRHRAIRQELLKTCNY
jgi:hypothetical protein